MSLETGSRIAQYRVERKLGAGGMGEVYLARDEKLNRYVAIKLLTAGDEGARRRLAREARAAASLDHPGICAVYEVGTDATAGDFIAMQYIEGETLAARLRRGRMSADEAMGVGAQIAEALVAAHRHGLVHRDLKPQNIIITPTGSARLLDFGLALHVPSTLEAANAVTSSRVTDPNMVLGTPSYMSPEQVRNEPADYRSDVFSLGCVLYECLTGRRAFSGATTAEVLGAILHVDPPPVSSVVPNVGPAYDALCARLLDKTPAERFHSAEEALGAIRALTPSAHFSTKTLRVSARPRRRRMVGAAVIAVAVVSVIAAWNWYQKSVLPVPTPEAESWYRRGVEAMRDGAFLGARNAFKQAIDLFEGYSQAYSRLAEANTALDDERAARDALVVIAGVSQSRWPDDEKLRFEAARSASLRHYTEAIAAYRQLVDAKPDDAGRWVDLGRALEASTSTPRIEARNAYQKAVELDSQSPAARLRLGVMLARAGKSQEGLASIELAIRLYRTSQRTEGEAEAMLRRSTALYEIALSDPTRRDEARGGFDAVLQLTAGGGYPAQNVGAQFGLAKVANVAGLLPEAEKQARDAIDAASRAGLQVLSATGLIDLGVALQLSRKHEDADRQLLKAIEIARAYGANRVEMRAALQRASLRTQMGEGARALELVDEPDRYFQKTQDRRLQADAQAIRSRALELVDRYAEALPLTTDVLRFAEQAKDDVVEGNALENLASQLAGTGRHPEAVPYRERLDKLQQNIPQFYAADLTRHAELLVMLGRGAEADVLLGEFDRNVAADEKVLGRLRPRALQVRALQAAIEQRWEDVVRVVGRLEAATPPTEPGARPPTALVYGRMIAEYALARLGRSRTPISVIAEWEQFPRAAVERREWAYWIALTLLQRGEAAKAESMALAALSAPAVRGNPEQGWRLAAVAALAAKKNPASTLAKTVAGLKNTTPAELEAAWGPAAKTYFARPDLVALRNSIR